MTNTIAAQFDTDDGERYEWLKRAHHAAALTIPAMLPPDGFQPSDRLTENYQSIGASGIANLQGKLMSALWPIGRPWFRFEVDPEIRGSIADEVLVEIEDQLYLRELIIRSKLESADPGPRRRGFGGFRSVKRTVAGRLLICGDTLEFLDDEFRLREFRNDAYVVRRDSSGDVLHAITKEMIDPLTLTPEELEQIGIDRGEAMDKSAYDRLERMDTRVQWNPLSKTWVIEQEMKGEVFRTSEEKVNPYFSTCYELITPEHFGRGFVELRAYADLRSADKLTERGLEFAALATKHHPAIDSSSNVTAEDLAQKSGYVIEGARVENGVVQDVGWIRADRIGEFQICQQMLGVVEGRLGRAMLLDSASVRDSERTTAFEVQNVTIRELEGALGDVYSSIADEQQIPLVERALHVMERKSFWKPLPAKSVKISTVTGLAALNRENDLARMLRLMEVLNQAPPEMWQEVNKGRFLKYMMQDAGIDRPGLTYTEAESRKRLEEAARMQMQMAAAGKAIDTVGNVAEARATAPAA